jgi:hypothetical protein
MFVVHWYLLCFGVVDIRVLLEIWNTDIDLCHVCSSMLGWGDKVMRVSRGLEGWSGSLFEMLNAETSVYSSYASWKY